MAKSKKKGSGADVLFRAGVQAHPQTAKVLKEFGDQVVAAQKKIDSSMRDVSGRVLAETDKIKREVELLSRGFGREQLAAFRAARDGAKSTIEATGSAVIGQIRAAAKSASAEIKSLGSAPQSGVAMGGRGAAGGTSGGMEGQTDRVKRILREYGVWTDELDKKLSAIESGPGKSSGRSSRLVGDQAAKDQAGEANYDNKQREKGILDRLREQEREEQAIAKRTAQFKIEWEKRVENAKRAGLENDSKFMALSARDQESVIKKREGLKKQFYANQAKMAKQSAAAEVEAAKKVENARRAGLEGDSRFMQLSLREQEGVIKKREALKGAFYKNQIKLSREASAAEREEAARGAAAQVEAVAKAQAAQARLTSSRYALVSSLEESTSSIMQLARGVGMLGMVGEENMEQFVRGLAKLQGTFDLVVGGVKTISSLTKMWGNFRVMMDAASAASAVGGAKSAAMTAALAREAIAVNATAASYARLNAGRGGGVAGNAVGAAGRVATGAAGAVATGSAATGAVGAGTAATGTAGASAAAIAAPIAAAIAAVASTVLAAITAKDFVQGVGTSGLGGGMRQGSVGDSIAVGEVKFLAMIDRLAAKSLSMETRAGLIDGGFGKLIPGLDGFGTALTGLTESSARLERAEKFRAELVERLAIEEAENRRKAVDKVTVGRVERDQNLQRNFERIDTDNLANEVKRFTQSNEDKDKQEALDRKIANEKRSLGNDRSPAAFMARSEKIAELEKERRGMASNAMSPELAQRSGDAFQKALIAARNLESTRAAEAGVMARGNRDGATDEERKQGLESQKLIAEAEQRNAEALRERQAIENEIAKTRIEANRAAIADAQREIDLRGQIADMERDRIDNARQRFGQLGELDQKKVAMAAERAKKEGQEFDRTGLVKKDRDKVKSAVNEFQAAQKELADAQAAAEKEKSTTGAGYKDRNAAAKERVEAAQAQFAKAQQGLGAAQKIAGQGFAEKRKRDEQLKTLEAKRKAGIALTGDEQKTLADAEGTRRDAIASGLRREDQNLLGSTGTRFGEDLQRRGNDQRARAAGFDRIEGLGFKSDEERIAKDQEIIQQKLNAEVKLQTELTVKMETDHDEVARQLANSVNESRDRANEALIRQVLAIAAETNRQNKEQQTGLAAQRKGGIPR